METWEARFDTAVSSLGGQLSQLRDEMRVELSAIQDTMRVGDEETRRYMRVLYEDLVDRIARLGESR